jgi:hypothetical protein
MKAVHYRFPEISIVAPDDGVINMMAFFIPNFILTHALSPQRLNL